MIVLSRSDMLCSEHPVSCHAHAVWTHYPLFSCSLCHSLSISSSSSSFRLCFKQSAITRLHLPTCVLWVTLPVGYEGYLVFCEWSWDRLKNTDYSGVILNACIAYGVTFTGSNWKEKIKWVEAGGFVKFHLKNTSSIYKISTNEQSWTLCISDTQENFEMQRISLFPSPSLSKTQKPKF